METRPRPSFPPAVAAPPGDSSCVDSSGSSSRRTGVDWEPTGDGRPNLYSEGAHNARISGPEHLTRPLEPLATAERLAVIVDVDALGPSHVTHGDRLMAVALDALTHVAVEVLVVAEVATERAQALQASIPRAAFLDTKSAVARVCEREADRRTIAISNDRRLLDVLGPDDRDVLVASAGDAPWGVATGDTAVRAVLWWLVTLRVGAGMGERR